MNIRSSLAVLFAAATMSCAPALAPIPKTAPGAVALADPLVSDGFEPLGQKNGIRIYRKDTRPGMELGAEGDIAAPPDRVLQVLIDYPNHQRWQEHLAQCRVLERGDGYLDVYERLSLPVISDRDFTLHVTWSTDSAGAEMHFAATPDEGPSPESGVVRVADHDGGWVLTAFDGGRKTHAVYHFHLDLAGDLPSWMGKGKAADDLVALFSSIETELPRYQ